MNEHGIDTAARLREVAKAITEHADQFQMGSFFSASLDNNESAGGCGTAACIGGWAAHLFITKLPTIAETGLYNINTVVMREALGLGSLDGTRLFHVGHWPPAYLYSFDSAKTPQARAKVACNRIEHFIKTGGAE